MSKARREEPTTSTRTTRKPLQPISSNTTRPISRNAAPLGKRITRPATMTVTEPARKRPAPLRIAVVTKPTPTTTNTRTTAVKRNGTTSSQLSTTSSTEIKSQQEEKAALEAKLSEFEENAETVANELQTIQSELEDKSDDLESTMQSLEQIRNDKSFLMSEIQSLRQIQQQAHQTESQLRQMIQSSSDQFMLRVQMQSSKYDMLHMSNENLTVQNQLVLEQLDMARDTLSTRNDTATSLRNTLSQVEAQLTNESDLMHSQSSTVLSLQADIARCERDIDTLEHRSRQDELLRRKLHNSILELKGNIRVFLRVRPLLGQEKQQPSPYEYAQEQVRILPTKVKGRKGAVDEVKPMSFSYDKVFSPDASQGDVFEEISALVQSALDGYNVCIFTYGQTGSGKTFTMEGPANPTPESQGMIPRAVHQIFAYAETLRDKGWDYSLTANYLEIYNEKIRDLLCSPTQANQSSNHYKIQHHDAEQYTNVSNLSYVPVTSGAQVHDLLLKAAGNRAVARTECNERSSRSHSVFQLRMKGINSVTGEEATGLLNLVDLAGSERLKESKATGDRLKETQNINSSLSSLGKVITALSNKGKSVPYRESKLTWLLRYSLGGNSKTLMFVNISPSLDNLKESVNSLRFAKEVNSCNIGAARKAGQRQICLL